MNGTIAAFGSSESADSSGDLLQSSDDTVETAITSDDDQPLVEIPRSSKLCRIEKTCPFKCSQEGFVVCIYCRKAVINADGCKAHILKFHKTEATWLCPIEKKECGRAMSISQLQELYGSGSHCRLPFEGIAIHDGFKCTGCFATFLSAQNSRRHLNDCRKTAADAILIPVKCQQPLSWNNPRRGISFQRIFHVSSDGHGFTFPEELWMQSQCGISAGATGTNRLDFLLNWTSLHRATFPDVPNSIFLGICGITGNEKWVPRIQQLADDYFELIRQTIVSVENAGGVRDLCRLRMHSIKDNLPCHGFYWLGAGSIPKYKSCIIKLVSFICRLCEMRDLRQMEIPLQFPILEVCFESRPYFDLFVQRAAFTKAENNDPDASTFTLKDFHSIVFLVFSQPVSDICKNDMDYFLMQFVRFSSLDNLLQQRPQNITHLVGCLKYICRATILIEAKSLFTISTEVSHDRLDPPCNLLKFTRRDDPTLFDKLCGVNSICFSVIVSESDVTMSGDKMECAVKKQTLVKLSSLQNMVSSLFLRFRQLMSSLVPASLQLHQPFDDDGNRTAGYSLFTQVVKSEDIKMEIKRRCFHEDLIAMQIYMRSAEEAQKVLCYLYMLTTGSPTRGVEMSNWLAANTTNCQRNMFYDVSKQLLYIKYSLTKTTRARQRDKMYFKFLSPELTMISLYYFGFIRPVERFGARLLQMPSVSTSAFDAALFVFDGRASTSGDYSILSRKFCVQHGIPPLGLRDLRQAIIGFSRAWLGEFSRFGAVRQHLEQFVAWQAAHSVSTHKSRYGGDHPIEDIESFFVSSVSLMWLLNVDLPKIGTECLPEFVRSAACPGSSPASMAVTVTAPRASVSDIKTRVTSDQNDAFHIIALDLLRQAKLNQKATFRTNLQSAAVVASLQREEMLYIGPCGVGKSNIFMLPLFIEQTTTALFVPYALVRRHVHLAAETFGIPSMLLEMSKPINYSQPPRLLVCAVEQIRSISGILFELSKRKLLTRIVIDEIQCLFTEEFRSVMGEQQYWRAQLAVGVPILFLSGSFRKIWEAPFQECMGPGIPIFREQTVLPNTTSYSIQLMPVHAKFYEFIMACYADIEAMIDSQTNAKPPFKCMIFVPFVRQLQQVIITMTERFKSNPAYTTAELVSYSSQDPPETQMANYQRWIRGSGAASVFVCTHAGAVGIDPPPNIKVYHLEAVWSIVSYFQAVGRSGRGSCDGHSLFITSRAALTSFLERNPVKKEDAEDIFDFSTTTSCKRRWLSKYFDNIPCPPCIVGGAVLCSSCKSPSDVSSTKRILQTNSIAPDPCVPLRETRALSLAFSRGDQIVSLLRIFASFKETEWCCLCYIFRRIRNKHNLTTCPLMSNGPSLVCFRCAGTHVSARCNMSATLPIGVTCFTCGCAYKVGAFDMHPLMSQGCRHGARDRLQISCWYAKRHPEELPNELKMTFAEPFSLPDEAYSQWMHRMDFPIPNNLRLFGELMQWVFRFNASY